MSGRSPEPPPSRGGRSSAFFLAGQAAALTRSIGAAELVAVLVEETEAELRRLGGLAG